MAHLTELQVENVKSHMMRDEDALRIKFKAKNTEFDTISRPHNEVEDYERMGYSVVRSSARKTTLSRKKDHGVQFEDDVWCMFYKLGFRNLNGDEKLVIQWGPNKEDTQQLDVVAVGDDAIFASCRGKFRCLYWHEQIIDKTCHDAAQAINGSVFGKRFQVCHVFLFFYIFLFF
jgi:DNA sulfur modification protein DndB